MNSHVPRTLARNFSRLSASLPQLTRISRSLPSSPNRAVSTASGKSSILSQSTILLQDGLDIHELPLVIRRMNAQEFPFSSICTAEVLKPVTEQDDLFRVHLQTCNSLEDIFKLLEIPGENVTANSAAFALQRLCQLREGMSGHIDSFIKKAILNELCETATKEIDSLNTKTLITLVKCYLNSAQTGEQFVERVNCEIEKRVGDGVFSISELCTLIRLLCESIKGDQNIVSSLWIHMGNRFHDINQENIAEVYLTLRNISHDYKYLNSIVDKQFAKCWWKLNADDMSTIVQSMTLLNHDNLLSLKAIGKWITLNGQSLQNIKLLRDLLTLYLHFSYTDDNFIRSLELFIPGKVETLDKTVLAMVMEYCRRRRYCPPKIFEAVSQDFIENGDSYKAHEIVYCLRPFGHLNYTPSNSAWLFSKIETVLTDKFDEIEAPAMLEILASFSYIGRLPINFINQIFSPVFISRLQSCSDEETRKKCSHHLQALRSSLILESPNLRTNFVNWHALGRHSTTISKNGILECLHACGAHWCFNEN